LKADVDRAEKARRAPRSQRFVRQRLFGFVR
jgi:hypothetical protein